MEACLEVGIPFQQDDDGYWTTCEAGRSQTARVLDAVAQRLGYAGVEDYAYALAYHLDDVQRRIQAL
jgi:hypothetical protein